MEPTEELNRIKELARARAKKHYEANKVALNTKRREKYAKKKPEVVEEVVPEVPSLTLSMAQDAIRELKLKDTSEKKYLDDLKRLSKMIGKDFQLSNPEVINVIKDAKRKSGEPYSLNTLKSIFQVILVLSDAMKLDIDKKPYKEQYEIYKIKSFDQTVEQVEEQAIPLWKDYLKVCRAKYGMASREYLLARFYDELTVRDDLGLVLSDDSIDGNYLFVRPDYLEVVINSYKTESKYGQIRYKLKGSLEKLTRDYIARNNLNMGDLLFGAEQLSPLVSKMNKQLGYSSGVTLYRHMTISEQLEKCKTPEMRVKLADAMKHSPIVQLSYLRKKKLI